MIFRQTLGAVLFESSGKQFKTFRQGARKYSAPMFGSPADAGTGKERGILPQGKSSLARVVPQSHRFPGRVLHHAKTNSVIQLIHAAGVFVSGAYPPELQNHHRECSAGAKFFGHKQASPPPAHNHCFDRRQGLHTSSSAGRTLRPVAWLRLTGFGRNALPKCLSTSSKL